MPPLRKGHYQLSVVDERILGVDNQIDSSASTLRSNKMRPLAQGLTFSALVFSLGLASVSVGQPPPSPVASVSWVSGYPKQGAAGQVVVYGDYSILVTGWTLTTSQFV